LGKFYDGQFEIEAQFEVDWLHQWIGLDWIGWENFALLFKFIIVAAESMLFLSNYDS